MTTWRRRSACLPPTPCRFAARACLAHQPLHVAGIEVWVLLGHVCRHAPAGRGGLAAAAGRPSVSTIPPGGPRHILLAWDSSLNPKMPTCGDACEVNRLKGAANGLQIEPALDLGGQGEAGAAASRELSSVAGLGRQAGARLGLLRCRAPRVRAGATHPPTATAGPRRADNRRSRQCRSARSRRAWLGAAGGTGEEGCGCGRA